MDTNIVADLFIIDQAQADHTGFFYRVSIVSQNESDSGLKMSVMYSQEN